MVAPEKDITNHLCMPGVISEPRYGMKENDRVPLRKRFHTLHDNHARKKAPVFLSVFFL